MKLNNIIISDEFIKLNTTRLKIIKNEDHGYKFYKMNNDDILLKVMPNCNTNKESELVDKLREKQHLITNIDFPIGKIYKDNKFMGQIIIYYENSVSIKEFCENMKINDLKTIYNHKEDDIKNLLHMLNRILDLVEELYKNGIYYKDINRNNFLIYNNDIKLIDFESNRISFNNYEESLEIMFNNYVYFINETLSYFNIKVEYYLMDYKMDFINAKYQLNKLEDYIRMQYEKNKINNKKI